MPCCDLRIPAHRVAICMKEVHETKLRVADNSFQKRWIERKQLVSRLKPRNNHSYVVDGISWVGFQDFYENSATIFLKVDDHSAWKTLRERLRTHKGFTKYQCFTFIIISSP